MPQLRTDIVDVYVFRRLLEHEASSHVEFLQMKRATGALIGTWQPVMGHVVEGETATKTAVRELQEETGYIAKNGTDSKVLGMWQLEEVNTYFLASHDAVVLSPCFAVEVRACNEPVLNKEHDAARWVHQDEVPRQFVWPGQRQAIAGIFRDLLAEYAPMRETLRIGLL